MTALDAYYAKRNARTKARHNARRNARIAAFAGDGVALIGLLALLCALVALMPTVFSDDANDLAPCAYEDSEGDCYWDAQARGNGIGRSFYVLNGNTYYVGAGYFK